MESTTDTPVKQPPAVPPPAVPLPMTKSQGTALLLAVIVAFCVWGWLLVRPGPQWEYLIVSPPDEILASELAKRGNEGWEMVTARRAISGEGTSSKPNYEIIFKRPIRFAEINPVTSGL